jgi:hypothetical protein
MRKNDKKVKERKKKKERKNIYVCVKMKYNELPGSLKCIRNFMASRLKVNMV